MSEVLRQKPCCIDKEGWVRCPVCGAKTRTKVLASTVLFDFPLYCPKCHHTSVVSHNSEAREGVSRE